MANEGVPLSRVLRMVFPARRDFAPLVADSPHSGRLYPADFNYACALPVLRRAEDSYLDLLFDFLPETGVSFLQGLFPRSYVDTNRADNVTRLLPLAARDPAATYQPAANGIVRSRCTPRFPVDIYRHPPTIRAVFDRVQNYYKPYHAALAAMCDAAHRRHGKVIHLDLHSMPSTSKAGTARNPYDIIIGTRDGETADPALVGKLRHLFAMRGYVTGVNIRGYKGQEIVARSGDPSANRHSIQLEINRRLYMDEMSLRLLPEMAALKRDLCEIMTAFRDYCAVFPVRKPPDCGTGQGLAR